MEVYSGKFDVDCNLYDIDDKPIEFITIEIMDKIENSGYHSNVYNNEYGVIYIDYDQKDRLLMMNAQIKKNDPAMNNRFARMLDEMLEHISMQKVLTKI